MKLSDMTKKPTFLLFLTVTRLTPGMGFIPSFSIALRLFFSLRLCFDLPLSSSCPAKRNKDHVHEKYNPFEADKNTERINQKVSSLCPLNILLIKKVLGGDNSV